MKLDLLLLILTLSGTLENVIAEEAPRVTEHVHLKTGAKWISRGNPNRFETLESRKFLGALKEPAERRNKRPTVSHPHIANENLDDNFDARVQWPQCESISEIRDQSSCGSCWAFGATEAMTDRLCIHSNGTIKRRIGATDLLSCCHDCGSGCHGGYPSEAWDYWCEVGITTGGSLEEPIGCRSYPFPKCHHRGKGEKYPPCPKELFDTPECHHTCDLPPMEYEDERTRGASSYNVNSTEADIMKEIMTRGPVEVSFDVFEDFGTYDSGIYFHAWGKSVGGHAVKMLGWGTDPHGVPYWLLANSWNEEWGEKGYFRILRGVNECGIEEQVNAGLPKL